MDSLLSQKMVMIFSSMSPPSSAKVTVQSVAFYVHQEKDGRYKAVDVVVLGQKKEEKKENALGEVEDEDALGEEEEDTKEAGKYTGKVMRFDSIKGYGFIKPEQGGSEVCVHKTAILGKGYRSLTLDQSVEYYVIQEEDGRFKAVDVVVVPGEGEEEEEEKEEDTKEAVKYTGKVMRFDSTKGFGFIKPEEGGNEVFVHQTSILGKGFRSLNIDESVEFFVTRGNDGRMRAADVTPLDRKSSRRETEECRTCGELGHYSRECAQKVSGNRSFDGSCRTCGEVGHMARDCTTEKEPVVCYACNRTGHMSRDCKKGAKGGKASGSNGGGNASGGKANGGNGGGKAK